MWSGEVSRVWRVVVIKPRDNVRFLTKDGSLHDQAELGELLLSDDEFYVDEDFEKAGENEGLSDK